MNEAGRKLKELEEWLRLGQKEHRDALNNEPTIAHPLDQAAKQAQRRLKAVTEGHADSSGIKPPFGGFVR